MKLNITEAFVQQHATIESFKRGTEYYERGAVASVSLRGNVLQAEVEGSEPIPYTARVNLAGGTFVSAFCSCPFDWGGWCKHIVATLLVCLDDPDVIEERPPLEAVLSELTPEQLKAMLLGLADRDPALGDYIEGEIAVLKAAPDATGSFEGSETAVAETQVEPQAFRRRVRAILHSLDHLPPSKAYWQIGQVIDNLRQVLAQAWEFIEVGDGRQAVAVLDPITDEYVKGWVGLDDSDGEVSGFFLDLDEAWTQAILSKGLTARERQSWSEKLKIWTAELGDYGIDDGLRMALRAAEAGWDEPELTRVLSGVNEGQTAGHFVEDFRGTDLISARLDLLKRQGRYEEYLRLAKAGDPVEYCTMLVQLGRSAEAVEYGLECLAYADDAFRLATALKKHADIEGALRIGQGGLTLAGSKVNLASWLCDLADATGQPQLAFEAAVILFQEAPDLNSYVRAHELAGDRWPQYRTELLDCISQGNFLDLRGSVEVFLHEQLVDDAIAKVEGGYDLALVAKVADAAIATHPDWVIQKGRRQAELIMDEGQSQYYDHAGRWLRRVMKAHHAAGQDDQWESYLEGLIARHEKKYKLRPMLEALRSGSG